VPDFDTAIPLDFSLDDTEAQRMPVFATTLALGDDVDWTSFTVWLSSLLHARGNDVLRVKGVVRTPAGRLLIQTVRRLVQTPEILPDVGHGEPHDADNRLVVIGRGYQAEDLIRSMHRFVGKGVEPPPLG
jgi:G3E family GTPase